MPLYIPKIINEDNFENSITGNMVTILPLIWPGITKSNLNRKASRIETIINAASTVKNLTFPRDFCAVLFTLNKMS